MAVRWRPGIVINSEYGKTPDLRRTTSLTLVLRRVRGTFGSGAGLRLLQLERRHFALDGEIGVVEHQRARDAVLVNLEGDGIDRRLLAAALGGGPYVVEASYPLS